MTTKTRPRATARPRRARGGSGLGPTLIASLVVLLASVLLLGAQTLPAQKRNAALRSEAASLVREISEELAVSRRLADERAAYESGDVEYVREAYRRFRLVPGEDLVVVR